MKVAILDDYQNVALKLADWSGVRRRAEINVFNATSPIPPADKLLARARSWKSSLSCLR